MYGLVCHGPAGYVQKSTQVRVYKMVGGKLVEVKP
jgi:hypothetical protein